MEIRLLFTNILDYNFRLWCVSGYLEIGRLNMETKYYELSIKILNEEYMDNLILALARQGHAVYLSTDNEVCFEISSDEMIEIKK